MFSQIENDMNELMDFELDKTSAVLLFAGLCGLAHVLSGWIGVHVRSEENGQRIT